MKRYSELLPGLLAAVVAIGIFSLGLFSGPERFFEDLLFSQKTVSSDIVIVAIDNKSLTAVGQWPWPREKFGQLLSSLNALPPKAVGIDVVFAELSRYGEGDDAKLASALQTLKYSVVMPIEGDVVINKNGIPELHNPITPRAIFTGPTVISGHVNLILDPDGVVRVVPFNLSRGETINSTTPQFSSVLVNKPVSSWIRRIDFAGPPGTVKRVSFSDVLASSTVRKSLAGKFVLIGATASDLHDEQLTPFSRGVPMSGVEIQAQIANMLLSGHALATISRNAIWLWILLAALLPALFFTFIRSTRLALILSVVVSLVHIPLVIILFDRGLVGNILYVNLAWILATAFGFLLRHFVLEKEKREIRNVFSKYVSKDVLEDILRDTTKVKLGGEEREATVFFSDVRGFTTLSEKLTPIQLTQFLNRYLTVMTEIALEHRGVVDKYIGDAIMVFWGAPLENKEHVLDAMRASMVMIEALHKFNEESMKAGDPPIDIGIGFNSGRVVAGNMGSEQRFDYTVMGDTVNLASRLEGQTKTYGIHIITSEYTLALVSPEELAKNKFMVREIDRIRVKGKKMPVTIYELVETARVEAVKKIKDRFDTLRAAYYKGDWAKCLELAAQILAEDEDGPTKVIAERARHFIEEPPETWEGVYDMKSK